MPEVKALTRLFSLHAYDTKSPNYEASCMVFQYGDRGFMFAITGVGFYRHARELWDAALIKGCRTLEGYVTDAHARLMKRACRAFADVEIAHHGEMAGQRMPWVVVKEKAGT